MGVLMSVFNLASNMSSEYMDEMKTAYQMAGEREFEKAQQEIHILEAQRQKQEDYVYKKEDYLTYGFKNEAELIAFTTNMREKGEEILAYNHQVNGQWIVDVTKSDTAADNIRDYSHKFDTDPQIFTYHNDALKGSSYDTAEGYSNYKAQNTESFIDLYARAAGMPLGAIYSMDAISNVLAGTSMQGMISSMVGNDKVSNVAQVTIAGDTVIVNGKVAEGELREEIIEKYNKQAAEAQNWMSKYGDDLRFEENLQRELMNKWNFSAEEAAQFTRMGAEEAAAYLEETRALHPSSSGMEMSDDEIAKYVHINDNLYEDRSVGLSGSNYKSTQRFEEYKDKLSYGDDALGDEARRIRLDNAELEDAFGETIYSTKALQSAAAIINTAALAKQGFETKITELETAYDAAKDKARHLITDAGTLSSSALTGIAGIPALETLEAVSLNDLKDAVNSVTSARETLDLLENTLLDAEHLKSLGESISDLDISSLKDSINKLKNEISFSEASIDTAMKKLNKEDLALFNEHRNAKEEALLRSKKSFKENSATNLSGRLDKVKTAFAKSSCHSTLRRFNELMDGLGMNLIAGKLTDIDMFNIQKKVYENAAKIGLDIRGNKVNLLKRLNADQLKKIGLTPDTLPMFLSFNSATSKLFEKKVTPLGRMGKSFAIRAFGGDEDLSEASQFVRHASSGKDMVTNFAAKYQEHRTYRLQKDAKKLTDKMSEEQMKKLQQASQKVRDRHIQNTQKRIDKITKKTDTFNKKREEKLLKIKKKENSRLGKFNASIKKAQLEFINGFKAGFKSVVHFGKGASTAVKGKGALVAIGGSAGSLLGALIGLVMIVVIVVSIINLLDKINPVKIIDNLLAPDDYQDTIAYALYEDLDLRTNEWLKDLNDRDGIFKNFDKNKYSSKMRSWDTYARDNLPDVGKDRDGKLCLYPFTLDDGSHAMTKYSYTPTGFDGSWTTGIGVNENTYYSKWGTIEYPDRNAEDAKGNPIGDDGYLPTAQSGHSCNTKDILAMVDVMFSKELSSGDDNTIERVLSLSKGQLNARGWWDTFKKLAKWAFGWITWLFGGDAPDESFQDILDSREGKSWGAVSSYCQALFEASHQNYLTLDIGYYPIYKGDKNSTITQTEASHLGVCIDPKTVSAYMDAKSFSTTLSVLNPYLVADDGTKIDLLNTSHFKTGVVTSNDHTNADKDCLWVGYTNNKATWDKIVSNANDSGRACWKKDTSSCFSEDSDPTELRDYFHWTGTWWKCKNPYCSERNKKINAWNAALQRGYCKKCNQALTTTGAAADGGWNNVPRTLVYNVYIKEKAIGDGHYSYSDFDVVKAVDNAVLTDAELQKLWNNETITKNGISLHIRDGYIEGDTSLTTRQGITSATDTTPAYDLGFSGSLGNVKRGIWKWYSENTSGRPLYNFLYYNYGINMNGSTVPNTVMEGTNYVTYSMGKGSIAKQDYFTKDSIKVKSGSQSYASTYLTNSSNFTYRWGLVSSDFSFKVPDVKTILLESLAPSTSMTFQQLIDQGYISYSDFISNGSPIPMNGGVPFGRTSESAIRTDATNVLSMYQRFAFNYRPSNPVGAALFNAGFYAEFDRDANGKIKYTSKVVNGTTYYYPLFRLTNQSKDWNWVTIPSGGTTERCLVVTVTTNIDITTSFKMNKERTSYERQCRGIHDYQYCAGHIGGHNEGVVFSMSNEQVTLSGAIGDDVAPKALDMDDVLQDAWGGAIKGLVNPKGDQDLTSFHTARRTGLSLGVFEDVQGSFIGNSMGDAFNLLEEEDGYGWERDAKKRYTLDLGDSFSAWYLFKNIFEIDLNILKGKGAFPITDYSKYEGWTKENMEQALIVAGQDWQDLYGFSIPDNLMGSSVGDDKEKWYGIHIQDIEVEVPKQGGDEGEKETKNVELRYYGQPTLSEGDIEFIIHATQCPEYKQETMEQTLKWVGRGLYSYKDIHNHAFLYHHDLSIHPNSERNLLNWSVSCTAGQYDDFIDYIRLTNKKDAAGWNETLDAAATHTNYANSSASYPVSNADYVMKSYARWLMVLAKEGGDAKGVITKDYSSYGDSAKRVLAEDIYYSEYQSCIYLGYVVDTSDFTAPSTKRVYTKETDDYGDYFQLSTGQKVYLNVPLTVSLSKNNATDCYGTITLRAEESFNNITNSWEQWGWVIDLFKGNANSKVHYTAW